MKYEDKNGIEVIEFGKGDVGIGVIGDTDIHDIYGVNFFPIPETEIGIDLPEYDKKFDDEIGTYTKLVFTESRSIQVLIDQLEIVQTSLVEKERKAKRMPGSEEFDCPRMEGNTRFGKAVWNNSGEWRVCSHCGSMHPEDVIKTVEEGIAIIEPTTKQYKRYIKLPGVRNDDDGPIKFYTQHFTEDQINRFNVAVRGF